jgi:tetratricopeptide (TPR) repeat protein
MQRKDLTFRVFVSSTFSDFLRERHALQRIVFPRVRRYCHLCAARFPGMEPCFQAIDLRWGVAREAARDQQTLRICLQELRRCQELSPKPNFLILLGERYGWVPLPPQIDAGEFEELLSFCTAEDRRLLLGQEAVPPWQAGAPQERVGWYRLDRNARPSAQPPGEYLLQPRLLEVSPEIGTADWQRIQREEHADWTAIEQRIARVLAGAITRAGWTRDDPRRLKHESSATHQEIEHGALAVADAKDHVFCYERKIEGLPEHAAGFRDLTAEQQPDAAAAARLAVLKRKLDEIVPAAHRYSYTVSWNTAQDRALTGVFERGDELEPDADLREFCDRVEADLKRIIDQELNDFAQISDLEREIAAQRKFAEDRSRHFTGRQELLTRIAHYLQDGDRRPLVIHGASGSGKTALLARSFLDHSVPRQDAVLLARFIGATPGSSDLRTLLTSLCRELAQAFGGPAEPPQELPALIREFAQRLGRATPAKPLFVFLDALDQLSDWDNAHALDWLPRELPAQVKLVASVLETGEAGMSCFEAARSAFPDRLIELGPLSAEHGAALLDAWLAEIRRTLQADQRRTILEHFAACPYPLYLKLAFEEARCWRSYTEVAGLRADVPGILNDLFQRLERPQNHGKVLTSRSLGYLAAARRGLSESELLDVLSTDQEVLEDFRRRSPDSPPVDHLPVVVWSRFLVDLEPYLTQREMVGTRLWSFYHRQVGETVVQRYLDGDARRRAHHHLADHFDAQDDGREESKGDHWPRTQPSNLRKVDELPWQLERAKRYSDLRTCLTRVPMFHSLFTAERQYELLGYWKRLEPAFDVVAEHTRAVNAYPGAGEAPLAFGHFVHEIGRFLAFCSRYDDAERFYRFALSVFERSTSGGLAAISAVCSNLGEVLVQLHRHDEAEPYYRRALSTTTSDTDRATLLSNFAGLLRGRGQLAEARHLLLQALELHDAAVPGQPLARATDLCNLATVAAELQQPEEAERHYRSALALYRQQLGPGHPHVAHGLSGLALLLHRARRRSEAEQFYREAIGIYRQASPDEPFLALCLANLGGLLLETGRPMEAFDSYRAAYELLARTLGTEHPETRSVGALLQRFLR